MANWTAEKMTGELQSLLGDQLLSVVLYGSAAGGDHAGRNSDINLLVVSRPLNRDGLQKLSKAVIPWVKQGNPPPLFLTQDHLKSFTDVFPLEILDIQHNHQVLLGPDPVSDLKVSQDHLKVELAHELQGKLLQLKTRFVMTAGSPKRVEKLMVESLSTFLVLFKGCLWIYGEKPHLKKMEALKKLKERVPFELEVFETLDRLKRGEKMKGLDVPVLFEKYLANVEAIVNRVVE